jgi:hypothetical protein
MDNETPVSNDYKERDNKFTGTIKKITVDAKPLVSVPKVRRKLRTTEI